MHRCSPTRMSYCAVMSDEFVPLAVFLRSASPEPAAEESSVVEIEVPPADDDYQATLRAARRFRAGVADALEACVAQLLRRIADEVLARELRLADADVAAIVAAALNRFAGENVLIVRAHPAECDALAVFDVERVADDALARGDIRMELRSGTIDLTLQARLDAALAACSV